METSKILSADWLDILFDNRNKEYGAYDLRKTYHKRINRALLTTTLVASLIIAGTALAGSVRNNSNAPDKNDGLLITEITEKKIPEKLPEPEKQPEPEQVKTQKFNEPIIVPDDEFDQPPPTQDDLAIAKISDHTQDGKLDSGFVAPPQEGGGDKKGILEVTHKEDEIVQHVEIQAKFIGDWVKFLLRNLNGDVPAQNGAPAGRHTVIIQFVVDKEGNVSDIKPTTHVGYGMEEEAIRVIRKATKWEPAIQNGYKVKAYRNQPITFEVLENE